MIANADRYPLRAIRAVCLDCCAGESKAVTFCTGDGLHSTRCAAWPFRFGIGADSAGRRYGKAIVTPELMPDANVSLDELPRSPAEYCRQVEVAQVTEAPAVA